MAVRFSWTVQEADGDAVVGANVDLYYSGGAKYADMTDNGDGSYYCSVAVSGKYDVYIDGTLQDEATGIWITADDMPTAATLAAKADKVSGATNNNLASLDTNGNLLDSGYDQSDFLQASHANANGSGGSATPATNKVHNAAAVGLTDSGGLFTATDVEAALAEVKTLIGTMDLSTGSFVAGMTSITNALLALNNQLYDLYLRGGDAVTSSSNSFKQHYIFTLAGNTGASGDLGMGQIAAAAEGFYPLRDGYISGVSVAWEAQSMSGTTIDFKHYPGGATIISVAEADAAALCKREVFTSQDHIVTSLGNQSVSYTRSAGSGTLTDVILLLEVTYGFASE